MSLIDWDKLRHEWKTVAVAVIGFVIEAYDAVVVTGLVNLPSLFAEGSVIRPWVSPGTLLLMLLLRRWKNRLEINLYVRVDNKADY